MLNIDAGLQQAAQGYLQQQILADRNSIDPVDNLTPKADNGAVIVMNPTNGEIYALASYPSYDLNEWVGGISAANYAALQATGAENDDAIQGLYTPGSTFKLVTATAALQDGLITPTTPYNDTGSFKIPGCPAAGVTSTQGCVLNDDPGDSGGTYNVSGALTVSSDSFFYNLGDMFWNDRAQYGNTPIQNEATQYGEGTITGIDLPGEAEGRIDSQLVRLKLHAEAPKAFPTATWYTGDNIEMAFGQGAHRAHSDRAGGGLLDLRQRGHPLRAPGGLRDRRPPHGQGDQEAGATGDRARHDLAGQLRGHALGLRGRDLEPPRHGVPGLPGLPDVAGTWPARPEPPRTHQGSSPTRGSSPSARTPTPSTWCWPSSTRAGTAPKRPRRWCATSTTIC